MAQQERQILTNAEMILPDSRQKGSVIIEDGLIVDITGRRSYPEGVDLEGSFLVPGLIDIHSDYVEREIYPRPGAEFPLPLAFHLTDTRAIGTGITTVLSAARFSPKAERGDQAPFGLTLAASMEELRPNALARHYLHVRWNPVFEPAEELLQQLVTLPYIGNLVYNDWTPGERQYRDMDTLIRNYAARNDVSLEQASQDIETRREQAKATNNRGKVQAALQGRIPIGSHDDTTIEHVLEAQHYGSTLAEMPVTLEAARKAKELGMLVCMGAPNYCRGASHCGNVSCAEALEADLVDILCSDYHFPSLLLSACLMMERGVAPWRAINMVTLNPARHLGLEHELGSIEIGKKADLVAFKAQKQNASVSSVWVDGDLRYIAGRSSAVIRSLRHEVAAAAR